MLEPTIIRKTCNVISNNQLWGNFEPCYLWSASSNNCFFEFTEITQNTASKEWKQDKTLFLFKLFIVEVFAKNTPTDKHDANFMI